VEYWLAEADILVSLIPSELRFISQGLVESVKQTATLESQDQIA
jgi:hypothetical protein